MKAQHVTECELLVMKTIWSHPEKDMALPEILGLVNSTYGKEWAPQTVSTFLKRLVNRGFLRVYRQGRSFFYHDIISFTDYREATISDACDFWFDGDAAALVEALHKVKTLTAEDKSKIQKMLKNI
ncbi:MAG: BlaI/MecI/CopY family transcriptional regulator [Lachnospiraceae bacterium]|nr:BlaI/MecI/CopY family transcriptional regulator [Lachnospiraceae bacterium]